MVAIEHTCVVNIMHDSGNVAGERIDGAEEAIAHDLTAKQYHMHRVQHVCCMRPARR